MLTLNILGVAQRREALCPTCVYAVRQMGFQGEELTSCNLSGGMRELKFAVCECTAYVDSRIPAPVRRVGFAPPAEPQKPKVTIIKFG